MRWVSLYWTLKTCSKRIESLRFASPDFAEFREQDSPLHVSCGPAVEVFVVGDI